jgi:hypothetical protein
MGGRAGGEAGGNFASRRSLTSIKSDPSLLYKQALCFARAENIVQARDAFESTLQLFPQFTIAWVSWAQMEKRVAHGMSGCDKWQRCRQVLQDALTINRDSPQLLQVCPPLPGVHRAGTYAHQPG